LKLFWVVNLDRFKDIFQEVYEQEGWEVKFKEAGIWYVKHARKERNLSLVSQQVGQ